MNCCKPEQVGTLKRIQILEDGRIPAKESRNRKIEGQKRRITRRECRRLWNRIHGAERSVETLPKKGCCGTEVHFPRKKVM